MSEDTDHSEEFPRELAQSSVWRSESLDVSNASSCTPPWVLKDYLPATTSVSEPINSSPIMSVPTYTNLVLEGGGVLGTAYIGALEELARQCDPGTGKDYLSGIINYSAASVGTIFAGALACGASLAYIREIGLGMDFSKFLDYGNKFKAIYNVLWYNGACNGDYFCDWYGKIINVLTGDSNITLGEIHRKFGGRLVISVLNITRRCVQYLDWKSHPSIPLVIAVRMAIGIAGIFVPVEYNYELYCDAGEIENYPIGVFHYDTPTGDIINEKTIGLMLFSDEDDRKEYPPITGLYTYIVAHLETIWRVPQKMYMDEQDWARTIKIPTGSTSSINFAITPAEINILIENGRDAVRNYCNDVPSDVAKRAAAVYKQQKMRGMTIAPSAKTRRRSVREVSSEDSSGSYHSPRDELSPGFTPPDRLSRAPTTLFSSAHTDYNQLYAQKRQNQVKDTIEDIISGLDDLSHDMKKGAIVDTPLEVDIKKVVATSPAQLIKYQFDFE